MNESILTKNNLMMKRLWNLDTHIYRTAFWTRRRKKCLDWLSANRRTLRYDDCIGHHLGQSHELDKSTDEMNEIFAVGHVVGDTTAIPHTRRAAGFWEELETGKDQLQRPRQKSYS